MLKTEKQLFGTLAEAEAVLTKNQQDAKPQSFAKLEIAWPGFYLRFEGTQQRVNRVMQYMLREAIQAEREAQERRNPN